MNTQLKQLREERKLSCARLAEKINTTEENIRLWEEGKASIPNSALKDLAIVLSCSLDEILGLKKEGHTGDYYIFAREREKRSGRKVIGYYGGVKLKIEGFTEIKDYSIDEEAKQSIFYCFQYDYNNEDESCHLLRQWVIIETLNNYILFINLKYLKSAYLYDHGAEEAPEFYHPEIYKILSDWKWGDEVDSESEIQDIAEVFDISETLAKIIKSIVKELEGNKENYNPCEKFSYAKIYWGDGSTTDHCLNETLCSDLSDIYNGVLDIRFLKFIKDNIGDSTEFINLQKIALIEIPGIKFWEICYKEDTIKKR
jgi:transcriptional regulator with XRE-family HTH domain